MREVWTRVVVHKDQNLILVSNEKHLPIVYVAGDGLETIKKPKVLHGTQFCGTTEAYSTEQNVVPIERTSDVLFNVGSFRRENSTINMFL